MVVGGGGFVFAGRRSNSHPHTRPGRDFAFGLAAFKVLDEQGGLRRVLFVEGAVSFYGVDGDGRAVLGNGVGSLVGASRDVCVNVGAQRGVVV